MPSLRELMDHLCEMAEARGVSLGAQCAKEFEVEIRRRWAQERIYIPPLDSRKDPARAEAIRQAAARLPTGVAAERFGVTRQYIHKVAKK